MFDSQRARRALARASDGARGHLPAGDRRAGRLGALGRERARRRSGWPSRGYALWTLFEYWLHRIVFHFEPEDGLGARLHWIIHGVHHDHPNDPLRLVMPPAVSVPLGAAVFGLLYLIFGSRYAPAHRRRLLRRLPGVRHDPLLPAPLPPARTARADAARAAHAPSLPGRHARLRDQRALLGRGVPHLAAREAILAMSGIGARPRRRRESRARRPL